MSNISSSAIASIACRLKDSYRISMLLEALGDKHQDCDERAAAESGDIEALVWIMGRTQMLHDQTVRVLKQDLLPDDEVPPVGELIGVLLFGDDDDDYVKKQSENFEKQKSIDMLESQFERCRRRRVTALLHAAVEAGQLPVVKWLHCEQDESVRGRSLRPAISAAENGRLEVLAWLLSAGYPIDNYAFVVAAKRGHIAILRFLVDYEECPDDCQRVYNAAASGGHLRVLEWLHAKSVEGRIGPLGDPSPVIDNAASAGSAECIRWALNVAPADFEPGDAACTMAAAGGHLDVLVLLYRDLGFPLSAADCIQAAQTGIEDAAGRGRESPGHEAILAWIEDDAPV